VDANLGMDPKEWKKLDAYYEVEHRIPVQGFQNRVMVQVERIPVESYLKLNFPESSES
jgi:hypothetical protein